MLDKMTNQLNFHGNALVLRGERQRAIASNIANADTPGYVARDFKFGDALREATGVTSSATGTPGAAVTRLATSGSYGTAGTTDPHHIPLPTVNSSTSIDRQGALGYAVQTQPSLDNNSVDLGASLGIDRPDCPRTVRRGKQRPFHPWNYRHAP